MDADMQRNTHIISHLRSQKAQAYPDEGLLTIFHYETNGRVTFSVIAESESDVYTAMNPGDITPDIWEDVFKRAAERKKQFEGEVAVIHWTGETQAWFAPRRSDVKGDVVFH